MPQQPDSMLWGERLCQYALADAVLLANGYRPDFCPPTAKERKRIAIVAEEQCFGYAAMVDAMERAIANFDDPIIYTGSKYGEWNSYQNACIIGWARYNWYDHHTFAILKTQLVRDQKFCNVCSHLLAFSNGWDQRLDTLIQLAREEEVKVKIIPYEA